MKVPFEKNAHSDVIHVIAKGLSKCGKLRTYLELGIAKGATFKKVAPLSEVSIGVDTSEESCAIASLYGRSFEGTTDKFFADRPFGDTRFDLIFIDACHQSDQVRKDLESSLGVLAKGGIVIMHDTHPHNESQLPHCQGAWEVVRDCKNENRKIEICTLPIYSGITVIRNIPAGNQVDWM